MKSIKYFIIVVVIITQQFFISSQGYKPKIPQQNGLKLLCFGIKR